MRKPSNLPETLSLHVPFRIAKRGGRKEVQLPADAPSQRSCIDNTMVKAVARAFRWQCILESGAHDTLLDLARAEKINSSYVSRVLRLTLLAPDIVDAILDGRQAIDFQLDILLRPFPEEWERQRAHFRLTT